MHVPWRERASACCCCTAALCSALLHRCCVPRAARRLLLAAMPAPAKVRVLMQRTLPAARKQRCATRCASTAARARTPPPRPHQRPLPVPRTLKVPTCLKSCQERAERAQAVDGPNAMRSGTPAARFGILVRWQGTQTLYPALPRGGRGARCSARANSAASALPEGRSPQPPAPVDRRQLLPHPATLK